MNMNRKLERIIDKFLSKNPTLKRKDIIYRADRDCLEWICPHGIGHTIWDAHDFYQHGCDGCCKDLKL